MDSTIYYLYTLIFLISLGVSLLGAYNKGNKDGKKEMLNSFKDKNIISAETYVKLLKILENEN